MYFVQNLPMSWPKKSLFFPFLPIPGKGLSSSPSNFRDTAFPPSIFDEICLMMFHLNHTLISVWKHDILLTQTKQFPVSNTNSRETHETLIDYEVGGLQTILQPPELITSFKHGSGRQACASAYNNNQLLGNRGAPRYRSRHKGWVPILFSYSFCLYTTKIAN